MSNNIYDAIRLFAQSEYAKTVLGEVVRGKYAELKQAQIELKAVIKSRDMYQAECAQLKRQVAYYQRESKKAA